MAPERRLVAAVQMRPELFRSLVGGDFSLFKLGVDGAKD